jgi:hypothetical protein
LQCENEDALSKIIKINDNFNALENRCRNVHVDKDYHELKVKDLEEQLQQRMIFETQVLEKLTLMSAKT